MKIINKSIIVFVVSIICIYPITSFAEITTDFATIPLSKEETKKINDFADKMTTWAKTYCKAKHKNDFDDCYTRMIDGIINKLDEKKKNFKQ